MRAPIIPLQPGALHLWLLRPDNVADALLKHYQDHLLNEAESIHLQRLRLPRPRQQYLLTRALVRCTLSRYRALPPGGWRFSSNAHGKPHIANSQACGLHFNVSHTTGLLVCAVTLERAVGVDVEYTERRNRLADVAGRFFSRAECRALWRLPPAQRSDRFFAYWTLKEAYIKARGLGLAIPLGRFGFELDAPCGAITLMLDDSLADDAERWRFWLWQAGPRHRLAACLEAIDAVPAEIRMWHTVPLAETAPQPVVTPPALIATSS